jgi:hypothetical protein
MVSSRKQTKWLSHVREKKNFFCLFFKTFPMNGFQRSFMPFLSGEKKTWNNWRKYPLNITRTRSKQSKVFEKVFFLSVVA